MIGGFSLQQVIGRGRTATVWLARRDADGARVALKLAAQGTLRAEWELSSRLHHPHVIRALACGAWDARLDVLVLEHASGGAVATRQLPLSEGEAASVLTGALAGLGAIHAAGLVHRDIKPAHLLARADGSICIADLGTACRAGTPAPAGAVTGTPVYAAPEQTRGEAASPAADIYSLGICAFELLTGRTPFGGHTLAEVHARHECAAVPRLPAALDHWQPVIGAMLAKEPRLRPDAAALAARLAALTGEFA